MTHWKPQQWIILGCLSLGLIIGFMTGMSVSPTVTTVIGLIFAFTGGSVIVLIKGRDPDELALMGKCLSALALAAAFSVMVGVMARANDWFYFKQSALYQLQAKLTVDEIIKLHKTDEDDTTVLHILLQVAGNTNTNRIQLTKDDMEKLIKAKVPASIIRMMLIGEPMLEQQMSQMQSDSKSVLYVEDKSNAEEKPNSEGKSVFEKMEEKWKKTQ